jgi:sulfite reductase (NADPH) hemoprotein beta-component
MSAHSVEDIKRHSVGLRGSLLASLANPITGALHDDDQVVIKYHGSYQQDDRDIREERRVAKLEPAYSFMIRTRTAGGVISPSQWLKLDTVATTYAERGLRVTTRQTLQFHGVIKHELKATMQAINAALIDTLAACGDVVRNVAVAANPLLSPLHATVYAQAAALSEALLPNTRAYYEIWLDEERVAGGDPAAEAVYGTTYLPRKFKIGFAIPPINDVDVWSQDLGFVAVIEDGVLAGYTVLVGGGMGTSHGDAETYPRLGDALGFITPEQLLPVATAVVTAQRDLGNRTIRKLARLKYTIDRIGLDAFRREVETRSGITLAPPRALDFVHNGDRFGWIEGEDGRAHLTLRVTAGRIQDGPTGRWQSGLRAIAEALLDLGEGEFRLTPNQNVVIAALSPAARAQVDALVAEYGMDHYRRAKPLALNSLACVALPTCGLAMAEAERYLPRAIEQIQVLLDRHDLHDADIHLRISGCPNGCSRPFLGEIALVGKAPGRYNLMLGADHRGARLNALYRENVDEAQILAALEPLIERYAGERERDERFGDFLVRAGVVSPKRGQIPVLVQA